MGFEKLKNKWENDRLRRQAEAEERKRVLLIHGTAIFKKYHISKAVLFGSAIHQASRADSDIDLYVHPIAGSSFWNFRHDLEEATGYSIDLYTDSDDKTFIKKIHSRGETIYPNVAKVEDAVDPRRPRVKL
jgi:predicted nucleotidyltransferase